jgi:hypothetical protein
VVGDRYRPAIRIEQQLCGIIDKTSGGFMGSNRSVPVDLTRSEVENKGMPVVVGPVLSRIEGDDAGGFWVINPIEKE